jgi:hypothetical protein
MLKLSRLTILFLVAFSHPAFAEKKKSKKAEKSAPVISAIAPADLDFHEDLKMSTNDQEVQLESIPPAPDTEDTASEK